MKEFKHILDVIHKDAEISGAGALLIADYEGGNDSGYLSLHAPYDNFPESEAFRRALEDKLGYGSWAGDFSCYGSIHYEKDSRTITYEGYETEEVSKEGNLFDNSDFIDSSKVLRQL